MIPYCLTMPFIASNTYFPPGADVVRFKAEVNFDGREITRCHLSRLDLELVLEVSGRDFIKSLNIE